MLFPSLTKHDAMIKDQGVEHICIINVGNRRECGQLHVSASRLGRWVNPRVGPGDVERRNLICAGNRSPDLFHYYSNDFKFQGLFERRFHYQRGYAVAPKVTAFSLT